MDDTPSSITKFHLMFDAAVLALVIAAAINALEFPDLARAFPLAAATIATIIGSAVLIVDIRNYLQDTNGESFNSIDSDEFTEENAGEEVSLVRLLIVILWILGYIVGIALIGLEAATIIFLATSLIFEGKIKVWTAITVTVCLVGLLEIFAALLGLHMPPSVLDVYGIVTGFFR